jgi:hypothetical protein
MFLLCWRVFGCVFVIFLLAGCLFLSFSVYSGCVVVSSCFFGGLCFCASSVCWLVEWLYLPAVTGGL